MSRNRDFNFRAPPPAPTLRITTPPPSLPTRTFSGMDNKVVMTGELKVFTLTQAQISSGVRESMVRSDTGSSLPSTDWAGTRSSLIPSSTGSTVSSLTPKLSTLNLSPSTVTSSSGSSLSLSSSSTTSTSVSSLPSSTTSHDLKAFPVKKFVLSSDPYVRGEVESYVLDKTNIVWYFDNIPYTLILRSIAHKVAVSYLSSKRNDLLDYVRKMYFTNMSLDENSMGSLRFLQCIDLNLEYLSFAHNKFTFSSSDKSCYYKVDKDEWDLLKYLFFPKNLLSEESRSQNALTPSHKIKALDLSHNEIADAGFMNIISSLNKSKFHLEYMDVRGNKIVGTTVLKELVDYMKTLGSIMMVVLTDSPIKTLKIYLQDMASKAKESGINADYVVINKTTAQDIAKYVLARGAFNKTILESIGFFKNPAMKEMQKYVDTTTMVTSKFTMGYLKCATYIGYIYDKPTIGDLFAEALGFLYPASKIVKVYNAVTNVYCVSNSLEGALMSPEGVEFGIKTIELIGLLE